MAGLRNGVRVRPSDLTWLPLFLWFICICIYRDRMQKEAKTHEYTAVLLMLMSMFLLMIFSLADQVRNLFCINWIMGLIIVEAEILAVGLLAVHSSLFNILFSLLVLLLVLVFVVIIGFTCQVSAVSTECFICINGLLLLSFSMILPITYMWRSPIPMRPFCWASMQPCLSSYSTSTGTSSSTQPSYS